MATIRVALILDLGDTIVNMINTILCFHGDYTQERKRENKETRNQANEIILNIERCHRRK